VAEEVAVLLELASVSSRLRAIAGTEVWQLVSERLSAESCAEVIETLRDIEHTARTMADALRQPGDYREENHE
jgi:hypothetical protein